LVLFQWRGVAMRAGAPKNVIDKLISAITQASQTPEFMRYMTNTNQFAIDLAGDSAQHSVMDEFQKTTERLTKPGLTK
jgi:tripartite-type tricarboxylate transporter receptor subunit TctC